MSFRTATHSVSPEAKELTRRTTNANRKMRSNWNIRGWRKRKRKKKKKKKKIEEEEEEEEEGEGEDEEGED